MNLSAPQLLQFGIRIKLACSISVEKKYIEHKMQKKKLQEKKQAVPAT